MSPPQLLSIVLPCYNESRGLKAILDRFERVGRGRHFELILVNNGSHDDTAAVMEELLPNYPFAKTVNVEVNLGYGYGLFLGLQATRGQAVAWSHADLQTDPADIFKALDIYNQCDDPQRTIVKGRRYGRRLSERFVSFGMQVVATIVFRRWLHEINAQPKLFDRSLLDRLNKPPRDFNFDVYVLYVARSSGWIIKSFPVQFPPRPYGESNWAATWKSKIRTIRRSIRYMFRLSLQCA